MLCELLLNFFKSPLYITPTSNSLTFKRGCPETIVKPQLTNITETYSFPCKMKSSIKRSGHSPPIHSHFPLDQHSLIWLEYNLTTLHSYTWWAYGGLLAISKFHIPFFKAPHLLLSDLEPALPQTSLFPSSHVLQSCLHRALHLGPPG